MTICNTFYKERDVIPFSAGAGRTGAFIAYDILLDEMKVRSRIDVYNCVLRLRKQRIDMVQNDVRKMLFG